MPLRTVCSKHGLKSDLSSDHATLQAEKSLIAGHQNQHTGSFFTKIWDLVHGISFMFRNPVNRENWARIISFPPLSVFSFIMEERCNLIGFALHHFRGKYREHETDETDRPIHENTLRPLSSALVIMTFPYQYLFLSSIHLQRISLGKCGLLRCCPVFFHTSGSNPSQR